MTDDLATFEAQHDEYQRRVRALVSPPAAAPAESLEERLVQRVAHAFKALVADPRSIVRSQALGEAIDDPEIAKCFLTMIVVPLVIEMNEKIKVRDERIAVLEARVVKLESKPNLKYCGVYDATRMYDSGDVCTLSGSMWVAKVHTGQRPDEEGDGARDWTLAVKRGRDGRDIGR